MNQGCLRVSYEGLRFRGVYEGPFGPSTAMTIGKPLPRDSIETRKAYAVKGSHNQVRGIKIAIDSSYRGYYWVKVYNCYVPGPAGKESAQGPGY